MSCEVLANMSPVVDVTSYLESHPGGKDILLEISGADASEHFIQAGHSDEARQILQGLAIGMVSGYGNPSSSEKEAGSETEAKRNASALFQTESPVKGSGLSSQPVSRLLGAPIGAAFLALLGRLLVRHADVFPSVLGRVPLLSVASTSTFPSWTLVVGLIPILLIGAFIYWAAGLIYVEFGYGRYPEVRPIASI